MQIKQNFFISHLWIRHSSKNKSSSLTVISHHTITSQHFTMKTHFLYKDIRINSVLHFHFLYSCR